MTDELSPEFLEFSEMLDREDSLDEGSLDDDGRILLDLREALREDAPVARSATDSAKEMADAVLRTHSELPVLSRFRVRSEHVLFRSVLAGKAGLLQGGAVAAVLMLVGLFEPWYGSIVGAALLTGCIGWLSWSNFHAEQRFQFLQSSDLVVSGIPRWVVSALFYTVPVLSVLFVGWALGGFFAQLEAVSYSSMSKGGNARLVGGLAAVGIWSLLFSALRPSWKAFRECSGGSRWKLFLFQFVHWVPMMVGMGVTAGNESGGDPQYDSGIWEFSFGSPVIKSTVNNFFEFFSQDFMPPGIVRALAPLLVLLLAFGLWTLLISGLSVKPQKAVSVKKALRRTFASLLLSTLPIALSVWVFYQFHLTRDFQDPVAYRELVESSEAWLKERRSVPAEQNGWIELRPYFIKPFQDEKENREVAERLGSLKTFNIGSSKESWRAADRTTFKEAKAEFLQELPRIVSSMAKPKFSVMATEGFGFEKKAPNYILYRSVSQGLALLVEESVESGDTAKAIEYATLGIKWANKDESGVLIDQMIRVACLKIAMESYESLLTRGSLNLEQLTTLKKALNESSLPIESFGLAMKHEIYAADVILKKYRDGDFTAENGLVESGVLRFIPSSYIESERKAYLNFSLAQAQGWDELASNDWVRSDSINPLNLVSRILTPNTKRAGLQFRAAHSWKSVIRLALALEEFRIFQGAYPKSLEQLVPQYLSELPRDAMQPQRWSMKPGFKYQLRDSGFQLISVSESYSLIQQKPRQVFDSKLGWTGNKR